MERPESLLERLATSIGANAWFARERHQLRAAANPKALYAPGKLISPVEGMVSLVAAIGEDGIIPDKPLFGRPRSFALSQVVRVEEDLRPFLGGALISFYLRPHDLHSLVAPMDMELLHGHYVPGWLFPLFISREGNLRNERLTLFFQSASGFPLILVMTAALMVAGMHCEAQSGTPLQQGRPFAHFRIGSAVSLCLPKGAVEVDLQTGLYVTQGQPIARIVA